MPRTKAGTVPKLQHHRATGQARVKIAGRDNYCGRWGSKESLAKYHRLLGEYFNGNGAPPLAEGRAAATAANSSSDGVHVVNVSVNAGRKVQRGAGSPGGRKVQRTTVQRYRSGESRRSRDFPLPRARHEECMQRWRCGRRSVAGC